MFMEQCKEEYTQFCKFMELTGSINQIVILVNEANNTAK